MRNFYCALNIFAQDLQPYEVKKVSCVQSRTPGRAWRSRRQCTGSPAGCFMIKGVSTGTQKEPVLPDKGVDLRESSHGVEVCVSTPGQLFISSFVIRVLMRTCTIQLMRVLKL